MIKLLTLSIDAVKQGCTDYTIVLNRDNNTERTVTYEGNNPFMLASFLYSNMKMSGVIINKIYYHKMTGLDVMVIGVLTCGRRPNQAIVLEAV
jgi:hypothetical protein